MALSNKVSAGAGGVALAIVALAATADAQAPKRFFFGPSYSGSIDGYKELFDPASPWDFVQRQAQVFEFHIHSWHPNENKPGYLDDNTLYQAAHTLRDAGMKVAVEAGGLRKFPGGLDPANWDMAGEIRAQVEVGSMARWVRDGGTVDILVLDSPFSHVLLDLGMPWDVAAHELADYLDLVKAEFPDIEVGLIEPIPHYTIGQYPTWGTKNLGDFVQFLAEVVPILEARGHRLDSFVADSPYTYTEETPGGWEKLVDVQRLVQTKYGMRFGWFVNDNLGGKSTEELFLLHSLEGLKRLEEAGGNPDDFNLRGWYDFPKKYLPEDKPFTYTGIARQLMHYVYSHYEARNGHSVTVTFEDGELGNLEGRKGKYKVVNGGLEITKNSRFDLLRLRYEEPTVALVGDMFGMGPGSRVEVALESDFQKWSYRMAMVTRPDGRAHVELVAIDDNSGIAQVLATGSPVAVDPVNEEFHFTVRQVGDTLRATVNLFPSLVVQAPYKGPVGVSIVATSPGSFLGRTRIDLVDVREAGVVTNVDFDEDRHIVYSLIRENLIPSFDYDLYLNSFEGMILPFLDFTVSILPKMQVMTIRNDHIVLRSTIPFPKGALAGIVYDGDFETVRVR